MSFNVGLNVLEVDGKAAPSIQAAPTSVAGFVIKSRRGIPGRVYRVTNWSQFVEHFGGYMSSVYGAYAVRGFFDNGGTTALVTRVVNTAQGKASAASAISQEGPWTLVSEATNTLKITIDTSDERLVEFRGLSAATLEGTDGPTIDLSFDPSVGEEPKVIEISVNGADPESCTFVDDDGFPEGLENATLAQVAAVMNRELDGIQAWVDADDGKLKVRTDREGSDASLLATGTAREPLGFLEDKAVGGNVSNFPELAPSEAVQAIKAVLPENFLVSQQGGRVRIQHPNPGAGYSITIDESGIGDAFNFAVTEGSDGDTAVAAVAASRELLDSQNNLALTVTAAYRGDEDVGAWGNGIWIAIVHNPSEIPEQQPRTYNLLVWYDGAVVETWENLRNADDRETGEFAPEDVINNEFAGSKFIKVTATTSMPVQTVDERDEPVFAPDHQLCDGEDGSFGDEDAELNALAGAVDLFELEEIQLLCCPETDDAKVVGAALTHCRNMGDRMFVGHVPLEYDVVSTKTYVREGGFRGDKVYGALYFPWIRVRDPIGDQKWIPPTGHILGLYARTERERGIWKAPAGDAARLNGALDVEQHITDVDHTDLVKNGNVNAVRFIPGKGIIIDSSRTLSTNPLWLYVNVRLLFNFVKSSLKSGLRWAVQEPNDETLWNKINFNTVRPFLMGLWRRGAFGSGAPDDVFTIKVDAENNPPDQVKLGRLTVEVYFYPSRPAETIVIIIGQQEAGGTASEG